MTKQELATRIWATANELRKTSRQASTRTIFLALCFTNTYQTRSLIISKIGVGNQRKYDFIKGPIANDNTMPVLNMYISGFVDEDFAIKRLLPQKLKDQCVFKTEKTIPFLKFREVILCKK